MLYSAKRAREVARNVNGDVDATVVILNRIEEASKRGEYSIVVTDYGFNNPGLATGDIPWERQQDIIIDELATQGYSCDTSRTELGGLHIGW